MIKLFHKLMTAALPVLLWGTLLTGCTDDKYNKINDLFQPRFVLEEPEVKGNSISLVWYKVNDAVSYTVEYYLDQYHSNLFMAQETTVPQLFVDDIPYGTTYYIRVRSNAADEANNSQWSYTTASTEKRPNLPICSKMFQRQRLQKQLLLSVGRKIIRKIPWTVSA